MYICYIDEAGCLGQLPTACSAIQPVCVIVGLVIEDSQLERLTHSFLELKSRFYPAMRADFPNYLDSVRFEIKGADLRKNIAVGGRRVRRQAIGFVDNCFGILEQADARLVGRVWIKGIGTVMKANPIYTSSIQQICWYFQHLLQTKDSSGIVIADSRNPSGNEMVAHSIFTQLYRSGSNNFNRLMEMPVFGHSHNHVGLQLADLLASAVVYPMAINAYCAGHLTSHHVRPGYEAILQRYGSRLRSLQHRYQVNGFWSGGLAVTDGLAGRSGKLLFQAPA